MATKRQRAEEVEQTDSAVLKELLAAQEQVNDLDKLLQGELEEIEHKLSETRKPLLKKRALVTRKIPNFWLTAIRNHGKLQSFLTESDEKCLEYLENFDVEETADSFTLKFEFSKDNPYFSNQTLTKTFSLGEDGAPKTTGTQVHWHKDKRPAAAGSEILSFFSWLEESSNEFDELEIQDIFRETLWPDAIKYYFGEGEDEELEEFEAEDEEGSE
eukprot:c10236_g1_i1.p1 GENE.c10236_g1_i1~~c10236_g1_i1.p1  ORF type:complete len:215 (+),score=51.96 c10236_g1_i1:48-692(+)